MIKFALFIDKVSKSQGKNGNGNEEGQRLRNFAHVFCFQAADIADKKLN